MKVCHMTSAHTQEDIRIFHKECVSLAGAGYETYLISCGTKYEKNAVCLIGVGKPETSRRKRMTVFAKKIYQAAKALDADIYHLHDPELLPYGVKLKRAGKTVIFDSHEDVPAQIMDKYWIPKLLRSVISRVYKRYESYAVKRFDAVVAATEHIAEKFINRCADVVVVNNYPKLDDIQYHKEAFSERAAVICYAGGIDDLRGEKIMKEAIKGVNAQLIIAGDHEMIEEGNVRYIGRQDRNGINELYGTAIAGLCVLKPIENYFFSKPIKVYEYMAAGLPYICSDFPEWRIVAEESGAGICVNPQNIDGIREAIRFLVDNREKGQLMGESGRKYVIKNCNWFNEEQSLLLLYKKLEKR